MSKVLKYSEEVLRKLIEEAVFESRSIVVRLLNTKLYTKEHNYTEFDKNMAGYFFKVNNGVSEIFCVAIWRAFFVNIFFLVTFCHNNLLIHFGLYGILIRKDMCSTASLFSDCISLKNCL